MKNGRLPRHGIFSGDASGDAHEHPYEYIPGRSDAPIFITCEHASERLPEPWHMSQADTRLFGTHWAYDLGAAETTRELAHELEAPAVLAHFTRLLIDPNRAEHEDTLFLKKADSRPVELNRRIDEREREIRLREFYRPYHEAVDRYLAPTTSPVVFAVHTFTPVFDDTPRTMEIGVLFDEQVELAESLAEAMHQAGFVTALNEPYSGREGLIFSVDRHAHSHGRRALEIEIRQDIATDTQGRHRVVRTVAGFFRALDLGAAQ